MSLRFGSVPQDLTLETLVSRLLVAVPGAVVTTDDWYARLRRETEIRVKRSREAGRQIEEDIIRTVDRAAVRNGPTKGIRILMPSGCLDGRISRELILLHSESEIDDGTVNQLTAFLASQGIEADLVVSNQSRM